MIQKLKKVIVTLLLLAVLAGSVYGALFFRGRTAELTAEGEALIAAAQERQQSAADAYDAIDPGTAEGAEHQLEQEKAIVAEAQANAEALEEETLDLESSIREAQDELAALREDEDNAYYLAVYDSYSRGMEKVEAAIEGN